jgi:hypothetical protein
MGQERQNKASACPVCGGSRWWRSRTGRRICQQCHPDPLEALQVLGDQTKGQCPMSNSASLADRGDHANAGAAG